MKVFSGGRGTGKTTELLEYIASNYDNATVVCRNPKHMYEKADYMDVHNVKFITIDDLLSLETNQYENLFFDDVDDILIDLFGVDKIKGYTVII